MKLEELDVLLGLSMIKEALVGDDKPFVHELRAQPFTSGRPWWKLTDEPEGHADYEGAVVLWCSDFVEREAVRVRQKGPAGSLRLASFTHDEMPAGVVAWLWRLP